MSDFTEELKTKDWGPSRFYTKARQLEEKSCERVDVLDGGLVTVTIKPRGERCGRRIRLRIKEWLYQLATGRNARRAYGTD